MEESPELLETLESDTMKGFTALNQAINVFTIKIFLHNLKLELVQSWEVLNVMIHLSQNTLQLVIIKLREIENIYLARFVI